jgi:hypothetical protein
MKGGHVRMIKRIHSGEQYFQREQLVSRRQSSLKSATVEEKTLVVQEGMERVLDSHQL